MYMYIYTYGINDMFIHTFIDKLNIQIQIVILLLKRRKIWWMIIISYSHVGTTTYVLIIFENEKHHKVNSTKP